MRRVCVIILGGLLAGCAASAREAGRPPQDFALGLTVLNPDEPGEPWQVPAWYLVEPGGEFRAASGQRTARSLTPPIVRALTPAESAEVWSKVKGLSLPRGEAGSLEAPRGEEYGPEAIIYLAGEGRRRSYRVPLDERVRPLAELMRGWVGP